MRPEQSKLFKWYDRFGFNVQVSAIFMCAILVVGLITSVLLTRVSSTLIYEHQIQQGLKLTDFMARQAEVALLFESAEVASEIANSIIDLPDVRAISIKTHKLEELFLIGGRFPQGSFGVTPKESVLVNESHNTWVFSAPVYSNQGEQNQFIDSFNEEKKFLLGYISILVAKDSQAQLIRSITRNHLWAGALLVMFLVLLMWVCSRALRPIKDLSNIMASAQGSEEAIFCDVYGPKDIAQMQKAFNTLMKDLFDRRNQLKKAAQSAVKLANHDSLTGLPNRAYLMQHLQLLIKRSVNENTMFAVLFLDLDHFKAVNDTMGHDSGDLLLKAVSERLQTHVQDRDFIARLSGDEFTVILDDIRDTKFVVAIAEKICHSLRRPFLFMRHEIFLTASIGISIFPNDGSDIKDLMKHADSAMFNAKASRDGFCLYKPGMEMAMSRRLESERELRKGIEQNQLELFYQPKFDLKNASLVGAEALLRWQHPTKGLIGPDDFVPLAEESDLIEELNSWVLDTGIKQLCNWVNAGHQLTLALNLSLKGPIVRQLKETIPALLNGYQLPAGALELEVTESNLISQPELIMSELSKIRQLGVRIALDDFGSGYSSLNRLKQLPVDVLKFDRLFIQDIEKDPKGASIVESIVLLAKALNMQTVAEGVETDRQRQILEDLQCDTYQGYLASKPLPAKDFEEQFLEEYKVGKDSEDSKDSKE